MAQIEVTEESLRTAVAEDVFAQGVVLADKVAGFSAVGPQIEAIVDGIEVSVRVRPFGLDARCACPAAPPCSHAVAAVLTWVRAGPDPAAGLRAELDDVLAGLAGEAADTTALARMLYALLTGYWPGDEPTALPPVPRYKGSVCTPRQIRAGVPAMLDAIAYRGLRGQAADAPLRPQTPAGMAMALRMVQRPSYQLDRLESGPFIRPGDQRRPARHARARAGFRLRTTLLRPAV